MELRNILTISWREFKSIAFSKTYLASIVLVPIVVVVTIYGALTLQFLSMIRGSASETHIVDRTGQLVKYLNEIGQLNDLERMDAVVYMPPDEAIKDAKGSIKLRDIDKFDRNTIDEQIKAGKVCALMEIPEDFFESNKVIYTSRNNLTGTIPPNLNSMLNGLKLANISRSENLSREQIAKILNPVQIEALSLVQSETMHNSQSKHHATDPMKLVAAICIYGILSMSIAIHGSKLTMSILEEKRSKIMEIMLSAVKPIEFMWGKIIGNSAAAMAQTGIWAGLLFSIFLSTGFVTLEKTAETFLKSGGRIQDIGSQALDSSTVSRVSTTSSQVEQAVKAIKAPKMTLDPMMIFYLVIFTVVGFLLYATIFAGIGAVCSSVIEAQYLETPLVFLMMFPTYLFIPLVDNPNSPIVIGASMFPYFSPFMMYSRICVDSVPSDQILTSLSLLAITILINVLIVSALYKGTILLYGKRLNPVELVNIAKQAFFSKHR